MTKRKVEPKQPTCIHCGNPVEEIGGKVMTRGKLPTHRHIGAVDCPHDGPLYEIDVRGL